MISVSELSFQRFCFRTLVSDILCHNLCFRFVCFRTFSFRTVAGGTSELQLGGPGTGGSRLQGSPGEPKKLAGGTGAGKGRYCRIKEIE